MTVPVQDPINVSNNVNGVTSVFPYNFRILAAADLLVLVNNIVQVLGVHYTVDGVGNNTGGNVTFLPSFIPVAGSQVVRQRNMEYKRPDDFQIGGEMRASEVNKNYDAAVMMIQQLAEAISRTMIAPPGSGIDTQLPAPEPLKGIRWNAAANAFENYEITGFSAPGGSALVGFIQAGVAAVLTDVQTKLRRMEINAEDYGVVADGVTDDTVKLEQVIAFAGQTGRRLIYPEGTPGSPRIIKITRPLVLPAGTVPNWQGGGEDKTIIRLSAASLATDAITFVGAPKGGRIRGIRFDQNHATTATAVGMLGMQNAEDLEIEFCSFVNFDKMGLAFNGCRNWKVRHSKFTRSGTIGAATAYNQAFLLSDSAQASYNGEFAHNTCVGSGTDFAGANIDIHHNDISAWGFGAGVTVEQTINTHSNSIRHNKIHNSLSVVDVNGYRPGGVENWGADTEISYNEIYSNAGAGMDQGGQRCRVTSNNIYNNGQNAASAGIVSRYGNATYNASGSYYAGNTCFDTQGTKTQTKGYEDQSTSLTGISFGPGNQWNVVGTTPEFIQSTAPSYYGPAVESGLVAWDPPSIAIGSSATLSMNVPGASIGDYVMVSFSQDLQGLTFTGYVTAANTVIAVLANNTSAARDVAAGNARARAIKPKNFSPF